MGVLSELLDRKIEEDEEDEENYFLGSHESLLCIHTVLSILSGQGETLTLDPHRFYNHLDRILEDLRPNLDAGKVMNYGIIIRILLINAAK